MAIDVAVPEVTPLTDLILDEAIGTAAQPVPADVRRVATHCVLDWLGVALAGSREPVSAVLEKALQTDRGGGSTLIGGGRASEREAALRNGTCGHVLDFDDVGPAMMGHPTAPLLPALLAVAERQESTGEELVTAFVAGFELESRLGESMGPNHYGIGFHSTATLGTFGAAAGAAALLDLDRAQWRHALGVAGTSAAGLKSAFGTMMKSVQVGQAAANGVEAARFAAAGVTAPVDVVEGAQGFGLTHSTSFDSGALEMTEERRWHVREVLFKYHASCYLTHSSIEGVRVALERAEATWHDIYAIVLRVNPGHLRVCNIVEPTTLLEAKFSLRFTAAMAALRGDAGAAAFDEDLVSDEGLRMVADKVVVETADHLPSFLSEVEIILADGRRTSAAVDVSRATPAAELGHQEARLVEKFLSLAEPVIGRDRAVRLSDHVLALDDLLSVRSLLELCVPPTPSSSS